MQLLQRRNLFHVWLGLLCALWSITAHTAVLSDVRLGVHDGITRLVIESDSPFAYRIFQLSEPARLVVDLPTMRWEAAEPSLGERSPLIEKSRYGLFRPDVLRLVFDLRQMIALHHSRQYRNTAGRWLLVIEFALPDSEYPATRTIIESNWNPAQSTTATSDETNAERDVMRAPRQNESPTAIIVMLDPGHGGPDPGAIAKGKAFEKDVVLNVAQRLQQRLKKFGLRALLTRDADYYIPLAERYRLAQQHNAQLFVSLHADSANNAKARGASIYTLSDKASDREAAKLADKENASDTLVGVNTFLEYDPPVQRILLSMSQRMTQFESARLADALLKQLTRTTKLKSNAHRSAGFAVLKSPTVPSVLVELGYLSNPRDRKKLLNPQHQDGLAQALAQGIAAYFADQRQRNSEN